MVVRLVLELEKPFLCSHLPLIVHDVHIHEDAAGIVLLADLHIVKQAFCLEVAGSHSGHIHKIHTFVLASEFLTDLHIKIERAVDFFLEERLLDIDILEFCRECGVTAMVAPICIEDTELGLRRVTSFSLEIIHHFAEVISIHRQPHLLAIRSKLILCQSGKSLKNRHRSHFRLFHSRQLGKILLTGLNCIDIIFLYSGYHLI